MSTKPLIPNPPPPTTTTTTTTTTNPFTSSNSQSFGNHGHGHHPSHHVTPIDPIYGQLPPVKAVPMPHPTLPVPSGSHGSCPSHHIMPIDPIFGQLPSFKLAPIPHPTLPGLNGSHGSCSSNPLTHSESIFVKLPALKGYPSSTFLPDFSGIQGYYPFNNVKGLDPFVSKALPMTNYFMPTVNPNLNGSKGHLNYTTPFPIQKNPYELQSHPFDQMSHWMKASPKKPMYGHPQPDVNDWMYPYPIPPPSSMPGQTWHQKVYSLDQVHAMADKYGIPHTHLWNNQYQPYEMDAIAHLYRIPHHHGHMTQQVQTKWQVYDQLHDTLHHYGISHTHYGNNSYNPFEVHQLAHQHGLPHSHGYGGMGPAYGKSILLDPLHKYDAYSTGLKYGAQPNDLMIAPKVNVLNQGDLNSILGKNTLLQMTPQQVMFQPNSYDPMNSFVF
ncbi:hypothetical protein HMI54_006407 [Coelomomyces lativittatus]|nr:hypothetical protein HMI56_002700 [Coelomomyces lativittatus]KAJ1505188.1 hypothetical protein HMI55_001709 [Coelomomyces lativittatus]KAJ1517245.1 hypothetical protein HMI54_006407 [Coelomomyces lativittatus]